MVIYRIVIPLEALLSDKKHHISSQNIAELRKRKELIILDMKMKLNSVSISEVFDICGRPALAAIEPCIS